MISRLAFALSGPVGYKTGKGSNHNLFRIRIGVSDYPRSVEAQERWEQGINRLLVLGLGGVIGALAGVLIHPLAALVPLVILAVATRLPAFNRWLELRGHALEVAHATLHYGAPEHEYRASEAATMARSSKYSFRGVMSEAQIIAAMVKLHPWAVEQVRGAVMDLPATLSLAGGDAMMADLPAYFLASMRGAPWGWALAGTVMIALIKAWPILAKQAADARAILRKEKRDDLHECQEELRAVNLRLDGLQDSFNNLKIEMHGILSAYRILETAEEARDKDSIHLRQARAILSAAFTVAPSTGGQQ